MSIWVDLIQTRLLGYLLHTKFLWNVIVGVGLFIKSTSWHIYRTSIWENGVRFKLNKFINNKITLSNHKNAFQYETVNRTNWKQHFYKTKLHTTAQKQYKNHFRTQIRREKFAKIFLELYFFNSRVRC